MITSYKKARHAAPSDKMSSLKKFTAVAVIGLAATVSVMSAASDGKTAYISDGEQKYTVAADSTDLGEVLSEAGLTLNKGDETVVTESSGDCINIEIKRAFPVKVTVDGGVKEADMIGGTVADALEKAGVDVSPNDFVTPAPDTELTGASDISVVRGVKVYLEKAGSSKMVYVPEGTVKEALKYKGCELCTEGNKGITDSTPVKSGMTLCVDEVLYRTTFKTEKVEPAVIEEACSTLPAGEKEIKQEGKQGKVEMSYKEKYVNGELVEKKEDKTTVVTKPVSKIVLVGTKSAAADAPSEEEEQEKNPVFADFSETPSKETKKVVSSDSDFGKAADEGGESFSYSTLISGVCTAYNEVNGITATGTPPKVGTVAVNPAVIPYGTRLYICSADGSYVYGYAVAEDTGDACMAGDIVVDLYMNSETECDSFGRQELNIYVLD